MIYCDLLWLFLFIVSLQAHVMRRVVLVSAALDGVSDGLCCSRPGGRPRKQNQKTPEPTERLRYRAAIRRTTGLIRVCYKHRDADRGCVETACSQKLQGQSQQHSCSSLTTLRLCEQMGLSLSLWFFNNRAHDSPSSSSSVFPLLAVPTSSRLAITLNSSPVPPGDSRSHWSSVHCSPHFLLSACKHEVTRSPVERSSDGVRAEMGVKSGLHVWEVLWNPDHRGSHAVLGVSRQNCPLQASGYNVLVGGDAESWGWELTTNQLWHAGQSLGLYPLKRKRSHSEAVGDFRPQSSSSPDTKMTPLSIPERILLVLDADARTLGFIVDGSYLGVAFKDLPSGVELFPAVSSVRGGASIRLRYLNGATCDPPALMALCGLSIRHCLGQQRQNQMDKLPLPPRLQHYLLSSQ